MPGRSVTDRLNSGEVLLMDGGTGTEILRRGAGGLTGPSPDNVMAWSAIANVDFADVVQQVHQDYIRCGADVIISHNFRTGPSRLGTVGLADRWEEYSRAAVRNAVAARDAMNPEVYIAGGIAPPTMQLRGGCNDGRSDVQVMGGDAYRKEFADHAKVLAEEGVDLLLPEFVGYQDDCVAAVDACAEAGLPVWLGVRHVTANGGMQYGETLEDLGRALEGHPCRRGAPHVLFSGSGHGRHPVAQAIVQRCDRRLPGSRSARKCLGPPELGLRADRRLLDPQRLCSIAARRILPRVEGPRRPDHRRLLRRRAGAHAGPASDREGGVTGGRLSRSHACREAMSH